MEQQYDAESGNPLCSVCGGIIWPDDRRATVDGAIVHQSCPEKHRMRDFSRSEVLRRRSGQAA